MKKPFISKESWAKAVGIGAMIGTFISVMFI